MKNSWPTNLSSIRLGRELPRSTTPKESPKPSPPASYGVNKHPTGQVGSLPDSIQQIAETGLELGSRQG